MITEFLFLHGGSRRMLSLSLTYITTVWTSERRMLTTTTAIFNVAGTRIRWRFQECAIFSGRPQFWSQFSIKHLLPAAHIPQVFLRGIHLGPLWGMTNRHHWFVLLNRNLFHFELSHRNVSRNRLLIKGWLRRSLPRGHASLCLLYIFTGPLLLQSIITHVITVRFGL